jgi:hypothetical protein
MMMGGEDRSEEFQRVVEGEWGRWLDECIREYLTKVL